MQEVGDSLSFFVLSARGDPYRAEWWGSGLYPQACRAKALPRMGLRIGRPYRALDYFNQLLNILPIRASTLHILELWHNQAYTCIC